MGLLVYDDNYITIQGFMRNNLGLCGNELIAFSIVFGFSQAPDTAFTGGLQYIADWCGCSYRTAVTVMQSLVNKELVIKTETVKNGVKFCSYRAVCKNFMGCEKISHGGSEKISHNNISIYNNKKETNKEKDNLVDEFFESEPVKSAINTWLDYKKENHQTYKPTGLKVLLNRLKKEATDFGDKYVIDEINHSISNNYSGIFAEKNYQKPQKQKFMHHNYDPKVLEQIDKENNWDWESGEPIEEPQQEPQSEIAKELAELNKKEFVNLGVIMVAKNE